MKAAQRLEHVKNEKENEDALESVEQKNDEEEEEEDNKRFSSCYGTFLTPHVLNILEDIDKKYIKLKRT